MERPFALAAATAILLYASEALYPGYRLLDHEHLRRRTTASVKVAALAALGSVLLPEGDRTATGHRWLSWARADVQPVTHWVARDLCRRFEIWGERAVVIAGSNRIPALIAHFTAHWQYGIRPEPISPDTMEISPDNRPPIALIAGIRAACHRVGVVASKVRRSHSSFRHAELQSNRIATCGCWRRDRYSPGIAGSPVNSNLVRRALDLAIAIPAILLAAPFILIAAAAIYAIDPGPVFFRQAREGLSGKPVHVLKLRTMYRDAEQRLEALFRENPAMKSEWSTHFKLRQDPRVLPVIGHFLRSTSLDELPQLVNIIAGDMAIVGTTPFSGVPPFGDG